MKCINTATKEFKYLAQSNNVSTKTLERLVYQYRQEVENEETFPSSIYVQAAIGKFPYKETSKNVREIWKQDYATSLHFDTIEGAKQEQEKALKYFPAHAVVLYENSDGRYTLTVREPVEKLKYGLQYVDKAPFHTKQEQQDYDMVIDKLNIEAQKYGKSKDDFIDDIQYAVESTPTFTFRDGTTINTPFRLNDQQEAALQEMDDFINSEEKTMTLSGYAGTGKTSLMEMLADKMNKDFKIVRFSATTNAAAGVLQSKVEKKGFIATTLFKLLGIRVEVDTTKGYDVNNMIMCLGEAKVYPGTTVIMDEASMINDELYAAINDIAKSYNLKIIYVADEAQLAPVKQKHISKVFDELDADGKKRRVVRLTKVERTGDNAILEEATNVRNGGSLSRCSKFNTEKKGVAYVKAGNKEKLGAIVSHFIKGIKKNPNSFKILAWRRATVAAYNKAVRKKLGYTGVIPQVGELMVGYSNSGAHYNRRTKKTEYTFINSVSYKVLNVGKPYTDQNTEGLEVIPIKLKDVYGETITVNFVDIISNEKNKKIALELANRKVEVETAAHALGDPRLYKERDRLSNLLFVNDDITIPNPDKTAKEKTVTIHSKVIDFGYAMTVHKSQGSTFTHVLMDDSDIADANSLDEGSTQIRELSEEEKRVLETEGTQIGEVSMSDIDFVAEAKKLGIDTTPKVQPKKASPKDLVDTRRQLRYVAMTRATDTVTVISNEVKVEGDPIDPSKDIITSTAKPELSKEIQESITQQTLDNLEEIFEGMDNVHYEDDMEKYIKEHPLNSVIQFIGKKARERFTQFLVKNNPRLAIPTYTIEGVTFQKDIFSDEFVKRIPNQTSESLLETIDKLSKEGLVEAGAYAPWALTEKGKAKATMSYPEIDAVLDFLHELEDTKENTAYIKAAIQWVASDSIKLPQDNEKVRQIFDAARKKHVDVMKYKTFGELLAAPEMQPKKKERPPFDPDTAKTFSNKRTVTTKEGRVFTVYDVENTWEAQREVCKALYAHYPASPWCLSTFTSKGEPTPSAKKFWKENNKIPRKIAYEDGKPVAFCSSNTSSVDDDIQSARFELNVLNHRESVGDVFSTFPTITWERMNASYSEFESRLVFYPAPIKLKPGPKKHKAEFEQKMYIQRLINEGLLYPLEYEFDFEYIPTPKGEELFRKENAKTIEERTSLLGELIKDKELEIKELESKPASSKEEWWDTYDNSHITLSDDIKSDEGLIQLVAQQGRGAAHNAPIEDLDIVDFGDDGTPILGMPEQFAIESSPSKTYEGFNPYEFKKAKAIILSEKVSNNFNSYMNKSRGAYPKKFFDTSRNLMYVKSNNRKNSRRYDIVDPETGEVYMQGLPLYTKDEYADLKKKNKEINKEIDARWKPSDKHSFAFRAFLSSPSKGLFKFAAKQYLREAAELEYGEQVNYTEMLDRFVDSFSDDFWEYVFTSTLNPSKMSTQPDGVWGLTTTRASTLFTDFVFPIGISKKSLIYKLEKELGIQIRGKENFGTVFTEDTPYNELVKQLKNWYEYRYPTTEEDSIALYAEDSGSTVAEVKDYIKLLEKKYEESEDMSISQTKYYITHYSKFSHAIRKIKREYNQGYMDYIKERFGEGTNALPAAKVFMIFNRNTPSDFMTRLAITLHEPYHALAFLKNDYGVLNNLNAFLNTTTGKRFFNTIKNKLRNDGYKDGFDEEFLANLFAYYMTPPTLRAEYLDNSTVIGTLAKELQKFEKIPNFEKVIQLEDVTEFEKKIEHYTEEEKVVLTFFQRLHNAIARFLKNLYSGFANLINEIPETRTVEKTREVEVPVTRTVRKEILREDEDVINAKNALEDIFSSMEALMKVPVTKEDEQAADSGDENVVQKFETPQGKVYGFLTKDDQIYLDRKVITAEHPIHEYTHLWDRYVAKVNPRFWETGKNIFKKTSVWQEVLNDANYGQKWQAMEGMTDETLENLIASEVHSRLTGRRGKQLLEDIARNNESKGLINQLKRWLLDFWKNIKSAFSPWTDDQLQRLEALAEQDIDKALQYLSDMTLYDFTSGVNPITQQSSTQATISTKDAITKAEGFIGEVDKSPYIKSGNKFILRTNTPTVKALDTIKNRGHKPEKWSYGEPYDGQVSYNVGYTSGSKSVLAVSNRDLYDEGWEPSTIMMRRETNRLNQPVDSDTELQMSQFKDATFIVEKEDENLISFLKKKGYKYETYSDKASVGQPSVQQKNKDLGLHVEKINDRYTPQSESPVQEFNNAAESLRGAGWHIEFYNKKSENKNGFNNVMTISLEGQPYKGFFELVKDVEDNQYSVHFKTKSRKGFGGDTLATVALTDTEKDAMFAALAYAIPEGGKVSTWGELSDGGVKGIKRFGNMGFTQTDTRQVKHKNGKDIVIPVYTKGTASQNADSKIEFYDGMWSRYSVQKDSETLYIFTDNTDRDSGDGPVAPNSWYAKKYGTGLHFPGSTTACIRGLENARPVSTVKWFYKNHKGVSHPQYNDDSKALWTDDDIEEFKTVVDAEFEDILEEWKTGKYKRIMMPHGDGFFNADISKITKERCPKIYDYLQKKYNEFVEQVQPGIPAGAKKQNKVPDLVITAVNNTANKAREIGGIDTLRHPNAEGMHFGNPFSHGNYANVKVKVSSVKEATTAFEQWLRGEAYQDVEPQRRQWILNQINSGALDGKPLVYYTTTVPDNSYGTKTYDYNKAPNHAHILQKFILEHQQKQQKQDVFASVKGENLSSKGSEFAQKLTNPGNNLTVEYKGKVFRNAEHAYQTWKSGEFDEVAYNSTAFKPVGSKPVNKATNYQTMVEILTAKLQQHPELIQGINDRGGEAYLKACTHNVVGDKYWESAGQNKFIEALTEAYNNTKYIAASSDSDEDVWETVKKIPVPAGRRKISYTPKGQKTQVYEVEGDRIYNKQNIAVHNKVGEHRNKIFANLALREGRAVIVEHKGNQYVVNNHKKIVSVRTGKLMEDENEDRKKILGRAAQEFKMMLAQQETISQISSVYKFSAEHMNLDTDTHTYYVDGKPLDFSATEYYAKVFGKTKPKGNYAHSAAIGNTMDAIYRDFFAGVNILEREYPNIDGSGELERKKQIIEDLTKLRTYLDERFGKGKYKVATAPNFHLAATFTDNEGRHTMGGTMDMFVVDKEGNIHIFDFKAKNHDIDNTYNGLINDRRDYTAQLNLYRAMLEATNPAFRGKVKSLQLIWMDTSYPPLGSAKYSVDDNGNISIDTGNGMESIAKNKWFTTPHLKENVEESVISLDIEDTIENLKIPEIYPYTVEEVKPGKDYTLHSGGANGSDSYWGEVGEQYGLGKQNHYYHGQRSPQNAPKGNVEISSKDYEEGRYKAAEAAKYNWGYQYSTMKDDRLVRNWSQVKYADTIIAIGHIVKPGERAFPNQSGDTRVAVNPMVTGGTGYAVGMAILAGKPVYVYDQERKAWFKNINGVWSTSETPTLSKNFAGIGTREINEDGKQAIRDVYAKTFSPNVHKEETPQPIKQEPQEQYQPFVTNINGDDVEVNSLPQAFALHKLNEMYDEMEEEEYDELREKLLAASPTEVIDLQKQIKMSAAAKNRWEEKKMDIWKKLKEEAEKQGNAENPFDGIDPVTKQMVEQLAKKVPHVHGSKKMTKFLEEQADAEIQEAVAEREEMQLIKEMALADGTFMLAPNGKPTNLNERQWLQVRTKAFKEWFGDWENDPANASKVVDENGEPLVVYHNAKNEFSKFSKFRAFLATLTGSNIFGNGFYFSNHQGNSLGNINMPVFLSVVNPSDGDMTSKNDGMIHSFGNGEVWYAAKKPNQIKSATANNGMFSRENDDIQGFIGKRAREEYSDRLRRQRPDLSEGEIQATLDYFHLLKDNKENTAYIKTAITWVANGSLTIPQDIMVAHQAFKIAKSRNVDIQKYKTLSDLLLAPEMQPKKKEQKTFNPDKAKTFSYDRTVKTESGRVFTVYNVENTEEGQREVCKAMQANYTFCPWCTNTFTATGEPTVSAKKHWKDYSAIPRKIAFENGKPVAFSSDKRRDAGGWQVLDGIEIYITGVPHEDDWVNGISENDVPSAKLKKWIDKGYFRPANPSFPIDRQDYILTDKGLAALKRPDNEAWWDLNDTHSQPQLDDNIISNRPELDPNSQKVKEEIDKKNKALLTEAATAIEQSEFMNTPDAWAAMDFYQEIGHVPTKEELDKFKETRTYLEQAGRDYYPTYQDRAEEFADAWDDFLPVEDNLDVIDDTFDQFQVDVNVEAAVITTDLARELVNIGTLHREYPGIPTPIIESTLMFAASQEANTIAAEYLDTNPTTIDEEVIRQSTSSQAILARARGIIEARRDNDMLERFLDVDEMPFSLEMVDSSDSEPLSLGIDNSLSEPLISYMSNENGTKIKGELRMNKKQLIAIMGSNMYQANVQTTAVKELLQNAFDAVKIAKVKGEISDAHIDVELDAKERTVTIKDNGIGMTPEIVQKAFFTIGGSYKGDNVDNRLKSGGLGVAKMAFLFSSEYIELSTVKDGVKTYVKTTPEQIEADEESGETGFELHVSKTNEPNGTTMKVKIPEYYYDDNGEKHSIHFSTSPSFLDKPMIGDVTVNVKTKSSWGTVKETSSNKSGVPEGYTSIGKATSNFGDLEIYIAPYNSKYAGSYVDTEILISGLHQFQHSVYIEGGKARVKMIVNILPTVGVQSANYPINNNREGFRGTVKPEIGDLNFLIKTINNLLERKSIESAFQNTVSMDVKKVAEVKREEQSDSLVKETIEEVMKQFSKPEDTTSESSKEAKMGNSIDLKQVRAVKEEQEEKKRKSSFDSSGIRMNESHVSSVNTSNLDITKPVFHNNTDMVIEEDGQKVLNELGSLIMELKSLYIQTYKDAEIDSRHGSQITDFIKTQYWGFSFDKEYMGVNVHPRVMNLLAINPFVKVPIIKGVDTAITISEYITHLIKHEFNHNYESGEGSYFTGRFPLTDAEFAGIGRQFSIDWKEKLYKLVRDNIKTFVKYAERYEQAENLGESFEGSSITSPTESQSGSSESNGRDLPEQPRNTQDVSGYGSDVRGIYKELEKVKRDQEEKQKQQEKDDIPYVVLRTPEGDIRVYGLIDPRTFDVYLDETIIKPEHPIHEYTHIWDRIVLEKNPRLWRRGVELMRELDLWKTIENHPQYGQKWSKKEGMTPEKLEFLIASEVHAKLTGEEGQRILAIIERKQGNENLVSKLKQWLLDFWKAIGKELGETFGTWSPDKLENLQLKDFVHMTLRDFVGDTDLMTAPQAQYSENETKTTTEDPMDPIAPTTPKKPEPTKVQRKLTEYEKLNRQIDALYNNEVSLQIEEIRHIAEVTVNAISDDITKLQDNPKLAEEWFPNLKTKLDFSTASRKEIVDAVGIENLIERAKVNISPAHTPYVGRKKKKQAFLVMENWDAIMFFALELFPTNEEFGIRKNYYTGKIETTGQSDAGYANYNEHSDEDSIAEIHGDPQQHWQIKMRTIDIMSSMSELMRRAFHQCTKQRKDENGAWKEVMAEWGTGIPERIDTRTAIQSVLRWTQGAKDVNEMIAKLEEKLKVDSNHWLEKIVNRLKDTSGKEADFQSQFFTTMCKPFQLYSVALTDKNDTIYTMEVNRAPALKRVVDSIKAKQMIGRHPLFKEGTVNTEYLGTVHSNNSRGFTLHGALTELEEILAMRTDTYRDNVRKTPTKETLSQEDIKKAAANVLGICRILGFGVSEEDLIDKGVITIDNLYTIYNNLSGILINLDRVAETHTQNYNPFAYDEDNKVANQYAIGGYIRNLLSPITEVMETEEINAFFSDGDMYQSYVSPSYVTMLVSRVKSMNPEERSKFFREMYEFSEWYLKKVPTSKFETTELWRNDLIGMLVNDKEVAAMFDHKVQLTYNSKSYMRTMSPEEYMISVFTEYFSQTPTPEQAKRGIWPAWFRMPIQSNKPTSEFLRLPSYREGDWRGVIAHQLGNIALQEMDRIQTVRMRADAKEGIYPIKNFDSEGLKFCFLKFLNPYLQEGHGDLLGDPERDKALAKYIKAKVSGQNVSPDEDNDNGKLLEEAIRNYMTVESEQRFEKWKQSGIVEAAKSIKGIRQEDSEIKEDLINFMWNDYLADKHILQMFVGDISCYDSTEELQKRLAQLHAPGQRPNIYATDYGKEAKDGKPAIPPRRVTDGTYRTLVIKDWKDFVSNIVENLSEVFDRKIEAATSEAEKDTIRILKDALLRPRTYNADGSVKDPGGAYWRINVADAQGYSCPSSYRKKAFQFGKWSKEKEAVYEKLLRGEATISDMIETFQPLKPFVYGILHADMGIANAPIHTMPIAFQAKNAEYLLIMADALIQGETKRSGKLRRPNLLRAIYRVMEESEERNETKGIDTVQFASAIKSGEQGVLDIVPFANDPDGGEERAYAYMKSMIYKVETVDGKTRLSKDYNTNIIKELPYENYCLQQEVPAHFKNHQQTQSSQERILVIADLDDKYDENGPDDISNIVHYTWTEDGKPRRATAKEVREAYEKVIYENIIQSVKDLREELYYPEIKIDEGDTELLKKRNIALSEYLQREIAGSPRYGTDLFISCAINPETGEFRIPKGDPIQSKRIEQLVNSLIKNRINKQTVSGGPIVQVSNFGASKQLNIRFKDKEGKEMPTEAEFNTAKARGKYAGYATYKEYLHENQDGIAHFEVIAPAWMKEQLSLCMDKDGMIDVGMLELIDPDLLKLISSRIPGEYKYSIAHMKVVGFMPSWAGDGIMFPYELTTIDDSDFDVDKRYTMVKNLKIKPRYERKDNESSTDAEKRHIKEDKENIVDHLIKAIGRTPKMTKEGRAKVETDIKKDLQSKMEFDIRAAKRRHEERLAKIEDRDAILSDANETAEFSKNKKKNEEIYNRKIEKQDEGYEKAVEKENKRYEEEVAKIKEDKATEEALIEEKVNKKVEELENKALRERVYQFLNVDRFNNSREDTALTRELRKAYVNFMFTVERPTEQSDPKAYRDNKMFDITWAILSNPTSVDKMLNPGGFEEPKKIAYAVAALRNMSSLNGVDPEEQWELLMSEDIKALKKRYYKDKDLGWFDTQVDFYRQNSAGSSLIGVFAVNVIAHAILESDDFYLQGSELLGKTFHIGSLEFRNGMKIDPRKDKDNNLVSKKLGSMVSASADTAKDSILNLIDVNMSTAGAFSALLRLGMPYEEVALFFSQDILMKVMQEYNQENVTKNVSINSIIRRHMNQLDKRYHFDKDSSIKTEGLSKKELIQGVVANVPGENDNTNRDAIDYKVLLAYQDIYKVAQVIRKMSDVTRLNSVAAAAGPLILDTLLLERKLDAFLGNTFVVDENGAPVDRETILEKHPILAGFFEAFKLAKDILGDMPANSEDFRSILTLDGYLSGVFYNDKSLMNKVCDFYLSFLLVNSGLCDPSEMRYYLNDFPLEFVDKEYKEKYPNNSLLNAIEIETDRRTDKPYLKINITGMDEKVKERLRGGWIDLYKEDKVLAEKLFYYCFFRGGIGFTPKTFMSLLPAFVKERLVRKLSDGKEASYVETFRKLEDVVPSIVLDQFVRNNWNNDDIVPKKDRKTTYVFDKKNGTMTTYAKGDKRDLENLTYIKVYTEEWGTLLLKKDENEDEKGGLVFKIIDPLGNNGEYVEMNAEGVDKALVLTTKPIKSEEQKEMPEKSQAEKDAEPTSKEFEEAVATAQEMGDLADIIMSARGVSRETALNIMGRVRQKPQDFEAYLQDIFIKEGIMQLTDKDKYKAADLFKKLDLC